METHSSASTSVAATVPPPGRKARPEISLVPAMAPALKAQHLFLEAKKVSLEHLNALSQTLETVRSLADAIIDGGDLYAAGLKEFAKGLSEDMRSQSRSLAKLVQTQNGTPAQLDLRGFCGKIDG